MNRSILAVLAVIALPAAAAHADGLVCTINEAEQMDSAGNRSPGLLGTVVIDAQKQEASMCTSKGCTGPYQVKITTNATGFELLEESNGSTFYAKIDGAKYAQMAKASDGTINFASGVCH